MTKRSFFRRFGAIIATIALAPEIAFNVKLPIQPTLDLGELFDNVYAIMRARRSVDVIDIYTDRLGKAVCDVDMKKCGTVGGPPVGILEQLQSMPRPPIDNNPLPPLFCKDCGREGVGLCMSCYDARIDAYNASV